NPAHELSQPGNGPPLPPTIMPMPAPEPTPAHGPDPATTPGQAIEPRPDPAPTPEPRLGPATAPEQAIEPEPAPARTVARPQHVTSDTAAAWQPACQLPMAVADFTGRTVELDSLLERLSGAGLAVTVVSGMLGAGKTALAIHAAHLARACFPDGQLYASLDDGGRPRDPQVVLGELLRGLGIP